MSIIIYLNPDDNTRICIMCPTGEVSISNLISQYITPPYIICNHTDIAHLDTDFTNCWQLIENDNGSQIVVNMTNAKTQWRDKLRSERTPLLQQLDIDYMRALEMNNTALIAEIVGKKQKLRDAPGDARIDAAATTEELKGLTLEVLIS